jgi:DNA-binding NtrC family response regulator
VRVLVVDDESVICDVFSYAFEKASVTVVPAESGEAALEAIEAGAFEAAVVDKNLPGMSGLELVRKIRAVDPAIAILVMTSYSSVESAEEALNLDVDGYVEKPFPQITAVVERVLSLVDTRKRRRKNADAPAGRPRALMISAAGPIRERLTELIRSEADIVHHAADDDALSELLDPVPDLVVVESGLFGDQTPKLLERIRRVAPHAELIVLSSRALGLRAIQKLIDLGVRRLVADDGSDARAVLLHSLTTIRRRTPAFVPTGVSETTPIPRIN